MCNAHLVLRAFDNKYKSHKFERRSETFECSLTAPSYEVGKLKFEFCKVFFKSSFVTTNFKKNHNVSKKLEN